MIYTYVENMEFLFQLFVFEQFNDIFNLLVIIEQMND